MLNSLLNINLKYLFSIPKFLAPLLFYSKNQIRLVFVTLRFASLFDIQNHIPLHRIPFYLLPGKTKSLDPARMSRGFS